MTIKKGGFVPVTKKQEIIGFIHWRFDGAYEATTISGNKTVSDALSSFELAKEYIQKNYKIKL